MGSVSEKYNDQLISSIPPHATQLSGPVSYFQQIIYFSGFTSAMPHCTVDNRSVTAKQNYWCRVSSTLSRLFSSNNYKIGPANCIVVSSWIALDMFQNYTRHVPAWAGSVSSKWNSVQVLLNCLLFESKCNKWGRFEDLFQNHMPDLN